MIGSPHGCPLGGTIVTILMVAEGVETISTDGKDDNTWF